MAMHKAGCDLLKPMRAWTWSGLIASASMTTTRSSRWSAIGLAILLLAPCGCSDHAGVPADAGGDASAGNTDQGWPVCTDDMAVDPNPNNGGALLLPPSFGRLAVTRPGIPGIVKIRDTYIAPAPNETTPDGLYYLTGTTADMPDAWSNYDGIELWSSPDLQSWTYLGFIWTFSVDAKAEPNAWFSQPLIYSSSTHNGGVPYQLQVVWAPEIHYLNGNWYIPFSMPGGATGILKSMTGKPTGPYRNALPADGFIARRIDASLFQDSDGTVYYLDSSGNMAPMNPDLSGLSGAVVPDIATTGGNPNGNDTSAAEGGFMFKAFNTYYFDVTTLGALEIANRYSSWIATTPNNPLEGPYTQMYEAVPNAGHNNYFKDKKCRWWSTMFGDHGNAPVDNEPALVPVEFDSDHKVRVDFDPRPDITFASPDAGSSGSRPRDAGPDDGSGNVGPSALCPTNCAAPQTCCAVRGPAGVGVAATCEDVATCTTANAVQCSRPQDCPTGTFCCAGSSSTGPLGSQCLATCVKPMARQVCRTPADCPSPDYKCTGGVSTGYLYLTCRPPAAPVDGGGPDQSVSEDGGSG